MKTFRKWHNKHIEDWGCYCSDDYKSFCRAFKNYLKREFPNAEVIGFKANHYDTSGFLKFSEDKYVYISSDMDRYSCKHNFNESGCMYGVLYRTAQDDKDFRGGSNRFSSMFNLASNIKKLVQTMQFSTYCFSYFALCTRGLFFAS